MTGELVKVPFHGDVLEAIRDGDVVATVLLRICDNLGIDFSSQLKKLKSKPWATVVMNTTVAEDGKTRSVATLTLDSLPLWLATIEPSRVKPAIRDKLIRYQKEAAKVLADHFFRRTNDASALLTLVLKRLDALESRPIASITAPIQAVPRFSIRQRLAWKGWPDTSKRQRRQIYKLAVAKLDARHDETPEVAGGPGGGGPARFYGHQLACLDEAIDEVRRIYLERDATDGPSLFAA